MSSLNNTYNDCVPSSWNDGEEQQSLIIEVDNVATKHIIDILRRRWPMLSQPVSW